MLLDQQIIRFFRNWWLQYPQDCAQQNSALDLLFSRPMCVSLRFLGGAHWASCHLYYMYSSSRLRLIWTSRCTARMRLLVLPHVLSSRRRERDTLGEFVNDFADFFSTSAWRGLRVIVPSTTWRQNRHNKKIVNKPIDRTQGYAEGVASAT